MGITPPKHDTCLFSVVINGGTPPAIPQHTIYVGLYVDDFVFFSESDPEESRFKQLLNNKVTTDFMGDTDFFLGSSLEWNHRPDGQLSAQVSQQVFTKHTASCFVLEDRNRVPLMTPYRLGCPIDSTPDPNPIDSNDPEPPKRKSTYQSICGYINWLAISTRPNVTTIMYFLSAYCM